MVLDHRIDIEDANGNVLDTVYFRDAVKGPNLNFGAA